MTRTALAAACAALCLSLALGCVGGGSQSSASSSPSSAGSSSSSSSTPAPSGPSTPASIFPRYDQVFGTASHNSYWINRSHYVDLYASGTEELLLDQLLLERVRAIELDIHTDGGNPGVWTIYHTDQTDFSQFHTLADALEELRLFHYALPSHEAINVILELKNTDPDWSNLPMTTHLFGADHTIDAFDRTIRDALGGALYEPKDLLARAPAGLTLTQALAVAGWPTTDELRGKFIFNVCGYWGNATYDWARYGGEGDIAQRACFPLRLIFDGNGDAIGSWPGSLHDTIPAGWLAAARDASVFWQAEDLTYSEIPAFLARGGIVRGADAYDTPDQIDRVGRGYHLVQTDYPWHVIGGAAPVNPLAVAAPGVGGAVAPLAPSPVGVWDPSRRLVDPAPFRGSPPLAAATLVEPGARLLCSAPDPAARLAYATVASGYGRRRLETFVATTRIGDPYGRSYPRVLQEGGVGGLAAAASRAEGIQVLRVKTGGAGDGWQQERLLVRVAVTHGGRTTARDFPASPLGTDAIGSLVALEVEEQAGGGVVARALSAGRLDAAGNPSWRLLATETFAGALPYQGLAFTRDVLFVGASLSEGPAPARPLTSCDAALLDGGAASVADLSWPAPAAGCAPVLAPLP